MDDNLYKRALKHAVLHRKNSLFDKSIQGAMVGDSFMSLIHTCELNGINPFDYLVAILRHPVQTEDRMPWNDQDALSEFQD